MKKYSIFVFFSVVILIMVGLYLVMSASSTISDEKFSNQFYLFKNHLIKAFAGIACLIFFSFIPYEFYKGKTKLFLIIAILLLIVTFGISSSVKGAKRWLDLGVLAFQPADLAKLALFAHLAYLIETKDDLLDDFKFGFLPTFFWIAFTIGLILIQPNISSGLILLIISFTILFVGGFKMLHLVGSLTVCGIIVSSLAMVFTHSRGRILDFINSIQSGGSINDQVRQAMIGLGSGGLFGVGIGHSFQRNLFLPEAYGDFIFAILGEETGLVGSLSILIFYFIVFFTGILISKNAKDKFGQLLGLGISLSFILYALVNASVASGLIPTTGLPLPFISYGGTSMIILCASFGILINIGLRSELNNQVSSEVVV